MQQRLEWQNLSSSGPELFERVMVPAIFRPWADDLVAAAAPSPGERMLDVACGTGIVARLAAQRVGATGRVVGLDISPSMLAIARAAAPSAAIEWHEGSATELPFPASAFDLVFCQQGLQYFPDRPAALREMRRVLAPGGRLALSVFCSSPGHAALNEAVAPYLGQETASLALEPLALADEGELRALLRGAGFPDSAIRRAQRSTRFSAPDEFIQYFLASRFTDAIARLSSTDQAALEAATHAALRPFVKDDGLALPLEAHVALARG